MADSAAMMMWVSLARKVVRIVDHSITFIFLSVCSSCFMYPYHFAECMCYLTWPCPLGTVLGSLSREVPSSIVRSVARASCVHVIYGMHVFSESVMANSPAMWMTLCLFFRSDRWVWNYLKFLLHVLHSSFMECMCMGYIHHLWML